MSSLTRGVVGFALVGAAAAWWGTGILALEWRSGWLRLAGNIVALVVLLIGAGLVRSAMQRPDK
jgi:hypothetical protein